MLEELTVKARVVGVKQSRKAIGQGLAAKAFLACDADPSLMDSLRACCENGGVPADESHTMAQLGAACRISVGASVVVLLK